MQHYPHRSGGRTPGRALVWFLSLACLLVLSAAPARAEEPLLERMDPAGFKAFIQEAKGTPVLVNVWASWCGPCRLEIPSVIALHESTKPEELKILGISVDFDPRAATDYVAYAGMDYPTVVATENLARSLANKGIPVTLLFDAKGKHIDSHLGYASPTVLDKMLKDVLPAD